MTRESRMLCLYHINIVQARQIEYVYMLYRTRNLYYSIFTFIKNYYCIGKHMLKWSTDMEEME